MTTGTPPMRSMSTMWYLPCGLVSAMCGTRAATLLKSSSASSTRASAAMASRCSTALVEPPSAIVDGDGVLERLLGHDLPRAGCPARAGGRRPGPTRRRSRRGGGRGPGGDDEPGQRHADGLGDRRHGVGGEHAGAGALGRAGVALDVEQLGVVDGAGGVGADGLEHADDVEGLALVRPGQDRPAVEEHRRQVEAGGGHEHPGQALVAAGEGDHAVEALGVHHASRRSRR